MFKPLALRSPTENMKLALQTDYALRTLMFLAARGERAHVADVAELYGISRAHVAKVVNQLARLGFLRSIRGVGGGIELVRPPAEIRIGEVVSAFEGRLNLLDCTGASGVCTIENFCKLKQVLCEAERIQLEFLNGVTLDQVVPTRRQLAKVEPE
ncbi:MAG: Rrf2 family transcriptional regulator [Pirellulaceae bacterium]|jgi:Rrf2 family nitric oxide-sensitive transcriptional repressor|nr:Rrf2 family transcriptional regulator [Pirellulaceae bacterium]